MSAVAEQVEQEELSLSEAVQLSAADGVFYSHYFFPTTFRQTTPDMHREVWQLLDSTDDRFVALEMFRGSAKTTLLRTYTSRRIAFAISHLIMFISNSEAHSVDSISWLKYQMEHNKLWRETFNLRPGGKWAQEEIEIIHGIEEYPIYVVGMGITGQVRGKNIYDYRPDLVVCDDLDKEETAATPEQRRKTKSLFFGAVMQSLAPRSESQHAKLALLQTPLDAEDLVESCKRDKSFTTKVFGCFDENGESRWPLRFSTAELKAEKQQYIKRNQLATWMREKECKIVAEELASFRLAWLKLYDQPPKGAWTVLSVDPAYSAAKTADYFAIAVLSFHNGNVYLRDYFLSRGVEPDRAVSEIFRLISLYDPRNIVVETVAFQKYLAWFLRQKMDEVRVYVAIKEIRDKRKKQDRIIQAISGIASHGKFHYQANQTEFLDAFTTYHPFFTGHDDLLDSIALGITAQNRFELDATDVEYNVIEEEKDIPRLAWKRSAP